MAKPKSTKQRALIISQTLFKYSDEKHPVDLEQINKELRPYALDCDRRSLNDTIDVLKTLGVKISDRFEERTHGVWVGDRPLSDNDINCLTFAITTNPHISRPKAEELLEKLKHFVTVYQEPLLTNNVEVGQTVESDDSLWKKFSVIQEAFSTNRRIQITMKLFPQIRKRISDKKEVSAWFTPRFFYKVRSDIYVVGFKKYRLTPLAINLKNIDSVKIARTAIRLDEDPSFMQKKDILKNIKTIIRNTEKYSKK